MPTAAHGRQKRKQGPAGGPGASEEMCLVCLVDKFVCFALGRHVFVLPSGEMGAFCYVAPRHRLNWPGGWAKPLATQASLVFYPPTLVGDSMYLEYEGVPRFKVVDQLPLGDFRPCISVAVACTTLRVSVCTPGKKRVADADDKEAFKVSYRADHAR